MRRCGGIYAGLGLGALIWSSIATAAPAHDLPSPSVIAVRHFASAARTRIVIELSRAAEPELEAFGKDSPTRLYIDLPGVDIGPNVAKATELPVGPVNGLRVGKRDLETTRLILAAQGVGTYDISRLDDPPRVVVDVTRAPPDVARGQEVDARSAPGPGADRAEPAPAASIRPTGTTMPPSPSVPEQPAASPRIAKATASRMPSGRRPIKIVIDPGHGGKDPGAQGIDGLAEKDVVLDISLLLAHRLRQELGATVVLTRSRDVFVPLEERTALANKVGADLFISVHANASTRPGLAGIETYYLNNTDDRATMRLANIENGLGAGHTPAKGETDLSYILSDLVQDGKLDESVALARALQGALVGEIDREYQDVPDLGVKKGPFYVLVGAHMPCVLVEVAFLTNPVEGKRLATPAYRESVADGLVRGVRDFMDQRRVARTL